MSPPTRTTHLEYMQQALALAQRSPPKPTNYRVGALLVDAARDTILASGYTLECEGNTHAEQCCFIKLARKHNLSAEGIGAVLPADTVLYTTVEPCNKRSVGNQTCVERILGLGGAIKVVYVGVREPEKFVGENNGRERLEKGGVRVEVIEGLEEEILEIATAGHVKSEG